MLILNPTGPAHAPAPDTFRRRGPDPERPQATRREFHVQAIMAREARPLIEAWHYAHGVGHMTAAFALRRRDCGSVLAVAAFNPPSLGAAKFVAAGIGRHQDVIGLSRLCYDPQAPRNAGTLLLAAAIRALPERWAIVATYADEGQNVSGTTYRSGNFRYLGPSVPRPVWTRDGVQVSTQRGGRTLTHTQMEDEGCVMTARARMHRYRFWRHNPEERTQGDSSVHFQPRLLGLPLGHPPV